MGGLFSILQLKVRQVEPLTDSRMKIKRSHIILLVAIIGVLVAIYYSSKSTGDVKTEKVEQKSKTIQHALKTVVTDSTEAQ